MTIDEAISAVEARLKTNQSAKVHEYGRQLLVRLRAAKETLHVAERYLTERPQRKPTPEPVSDWIAVRVERGGFTFPSVILKAFEAETGEQTNARQIFRGLIAAGLVETANHAVVCHLKPLA